jgi:hypothetical protein
LYFNRLNYMLNLRYFVITKSSLLLRAETLKGGLERFLHLLLDGLVDYLKGGNEVKYDIGRDCRIDYYWCRLSN